MHPPPGCPLSPGIALGPAQNASSFRGLGLLLRPRQAVPLGAAEPGALRECLQLDLDSLGIKVQLCPAGGTGPSAPWEQPCILPSQSRWLAHSSSVPQDWGHIAGKSAPLHSPRGRINLFAHLHLPRSIPNWGHQFSHHSLGSAWLSRRPLRWQDTWHQGDSVTSLFNGTGYDFPDTVLSRGCECVRVHGCVLVHGCVCVCMCTCVCMHGCVCVHVWV